MPSDEVIKNIGSVENIRLFYQLDNNPFGTINLDAVLGPGEFIHWLEIHPKSYFNMIISPANIM